MCTYFNPPNHHHEFRCGTTGNTYFVGSFFSFTPMADLCSPTGHACTGFNIHPLFYSDLSQRLDMDKVRLHSPTPQSVFSSRKVQPSRFMRVSQIRNTMSSCCGSFADSVDTSYGSCKSRMIASQPCERHTSVKVCSFDGRCLC